MPNEFSVRKKWLESYPLGGGEDGRVESFTKGTGFLSNK